MGGPTRTSPARRGKQDTGCGADGEHYVLVWHNGNAERGDVVFRGFRLCWCTGKKIPSTRRATKIFLLSATQPHSGTRFDGDGGHFFGEQYFIYGIDSEVPGKPAT